MSVTTAQGFVAGGRHCGIKASGNPDLSMVATADGRPVPAAGVFTQNHACAGPVRVSRRPHAAPTGHAVAVVLNSGNANCATGTDVAVAEEMDALTAAALGDGVTAEHVLVCSTGLIGIPLDPAPLRTGIPLLAAGLDTGAEAGARAAQAIMTTDTVAKQAVAGDGTFTGGGMAKGAAMLSPNMATMLAVLTTDAQVSSAALQASLSAGVARSFNRLVVDGCTSTNDTVLLLASGVAGPPADPDAFDAAVAEVCLSLAHQMARDAEGHTKVVTIRIQGAASDDEADRAARKLANSLLVKCSFYGNDPYWGRVLSDLGTAGVALDTDVLTVAYDEVVVSRGLGPTGAAAGHVTAKDEFTLTCDLGVGEGTAWVFTNDLTHAYVDENMGTS